MDINWLSALVIIACGAFILVYGAMLFRFVLAVGAFFIGYTLGQMWSFTADATIQFLISVVLGGILAALAYGFVRFALNIAGALLGFVIGLLINSILQLDSQWVNSGIAIAAAVVGGIFGTRLGEWVTILACAITGSYAIVAGMNMLFNHEKLSTLPRTWEALIVFLIFAIIGTLAQHQIVDLRRRLLRR